MSSDNGNQKPVQVPHTTMWIRIMNDPKSHTNTLPMYDDASQKEFERRCLAFISTSFSDVVSILFWGGCINSKIHFPIARDVVAYAHWYVNNPEMRTCYDMELEEYIEFLKQVDIKIKQVNEPTIVNWQLVFGENYPFHVTKSFLIEYYKKIKQMIAFGVVMPHDIVTDVEQVDVEQMKKEHQEEIERNRKSTEEFMRKMNETYARK
jgi:hypothetical protein